MSRGLLRRLASPRVAAWAMAAGGLLAGIAFVVPQATFLTPAQMGVLRQSQPTLIRLLELSGLDSIYGGWPTWVIAAVIAVNVGACTILRIRSRRSVAVRVSPAPLAFEADVAGPGALEELARAFEASGWKAVAAGPASAALRRGRTGFAGSILMHVSLILLIVAAAVTAATSFRGYAVLSEGEAVTDAASSYLQVRSGPLARDDFTGARIGFDGVRTLYAAGALQSGSATVTVSGHSGASAARVRVNHPLDASGRTIYLEQLGLSADLTAASPAGTRTLTVALGERNGATWSDRARLGGESVGLELRGGAGAGEPLVVRAPRLRVRAGALDRELTPGEAVRLGDGTTLTFEGARRWGRLLVRSEQGRDLVYLAFWLILAGSAVRFLVPDERLTLSWVSGAEGSRLAVGYSGRPWPPPGRLRSIRATLHLREHHGEEPA